MPGDDGGCPWRAWRVERVRTVASFSVHAAVAAATAGRATARALTHTNTTHAQSTHSRPGARACTHTAHAGTHTHAHAKAHVMHAQVLDHARTQHTHSHRALTHTQARPRTHHPLAVRLEASSSVRLLLLSPSRCSTSRPVAVCRAQPPRATSPSPHPRPPQHRAWRGPGFPGWVSNKASGGRATATSAGAPSPPQVFPRAR